METGADDRPLSPRPSTMDRAAFVARFGGVYEHSPWIAERAYDAGLTPAEDTVSGLAGRMSAVLASADDAEKLALIRAHPDLAGKAAVAGELTNESRSEQAGAGLDRLTPEEFGRFQTLNDRYRTKFGFPFIIAVTGLDKTAILGEFERRIDNAHDAELGEALRQIDRIARLRLRALAGG